jgi:hypothetical protein
MTSTLHVLVAGFPRAGKSSFADAVERSDLGLSHVPMDRYIRPIPPGRDFLSWVGTPACVDWELLLEHLRMLESGRICFTPRPDWAERGRWICSGGAREDGLGRKMVPARKGYLIVGTHVFLLGKVLGRSVKVVVESPEFVVASRLAGRAVEEEEKDSVMLAHLGRNLEALRGSRGEADLVISGTAPHASQIHALRDYLEQISTER